VKRIEIDEASESLGDYARHVKKDPVIITKRGKPVAALISIDTTDAESLDLSTNPQFLDLISHSRKRLKREGGIPAEEMRLRLGLKKRRL